jgi:hypothetical protein
MTLEQHFQNVVREAGRSDAPIQAWPLMRRIGQLPDEVQDLAIKQISHLLDTFELLGAQIEASKGPAICPPAPMAWTPDNN